MFPRIKGSLNYFCNISNIGTFSRYDSKSCSLLPFSAAFTPFFLSSSWQHSGKARQLVLDDLLQQKIHILVLLFQFHFRPTFRLLIPPFSLPAQYVVIYVCKLYIIIKYNETERFPIIIRLSTYLYMSEDGNIGNLSPGSIFR